MPRETVVRTFLPSAACTTAPRTACAESARRWRAPGPGPSREEGGRTPRPPCAPRCRSTAAAVSLPRTTEVMAPDTATSTASPHRVPVAVVHALEPVQVHHHDGEGLAAALRARLLLAQPRPEVARAAEGFQPCSPALCDSLPPFILLEVRRLRVATSAGRIRCLRVAASAGRVRCLRRRNSRRRRSASPDLTPCRGFAANPFIHYLVARPSPSCIHRPASSLSRAEP